MTYSKSPKVALGLLSHNGNLLYIQWQLSNRVYAYTIAGTLALLFPGASYSAELVMPVDVPVGYQPPPPPPPPVVCSDILDREGCLSESCSW